MEERITFADIEGLQKKEKGTFGEVLAGIYLKNQIRQHPSLIADNVINEADPRVWISHIHGPTYLQRLCFETGSDSEDNTVTWEPDFSFEATLPDYDIRKRIFIEAKIGLSRPRGDQLVAMQMAADQVTPIGTTGLSQPTAPDERMVYICQLELSQNAANLSYEQI